MSFRDPKDIIISIVVIVCSITLHEFGHAISADRLGDPTPRSQGRITLWPDKHFDLVGFGMMLFTCIFGFGIGWGLPVQVQPRFFKKPNRDMMIVTICGPLMNLLLALAFGIPLRFIIANETWSETSLQFHFFEAVVRINLSLMFFNMIPIPPLDGSKIVHGLLSFDMAVKYDRFMKDYGMMLLIAVIFFAGSAILGPAVLRSMELLLNVSYH